MSKNIIKLAGDLEKYQALVDQTKAAIYAELGMQSPGVKAGGKIVVPFNTKGLVRAAKAGKKGKRGKTGADILKALEGKKLETGEIKKAIGYTGANLSAVLAGIKKSGKIEKDKDGKWSVKK